MPADGVFFGVIAVIAVLVFIASLPDDEEEGS